MKYLKTIVLLLLCALSITPSIDAIGNRPSEPPSRNPYFTVIDSSDQQVTLRYERPVGDPYLRNTSSLFVGIPIDATYEISFNSWEADLYVKRERVQSLSSEQSTPQDATFSMLDMIPSFIKTERFAYQELDVLRLQVTPNTDSPLTAGASAYNRDKIALNRLEFTLRWEGGADKPVQEKSELDAGYSRLYRSMLVNADQAMNLRAKRILPEEEKTLGFAPQVVGYPAEWNAVPPVSGEQEFRLDGMRVRTREEGMQAIRSHDVEIQGMDPKAVKLDQARLWDRNREIPVFIQDDGDGVLGESDAIYFFSQETDSEYTNDRIYFLTWFAMDTPPLRIQNVEIQSVEGGDSVVIARQIIDSDHVLAKEKIDQYGWYHKALDRQENVIDVHLPGIHPEGDVLVKIRMRNNARKQTGMSVYFGGRLHIASVSVNDVTTMELIYPADALVPDATLQINLDDEPDKPGERGMSAKGGDEPYVFIDSIEVIYPRSTNLKDAPLWIEHNLVASEAIEFSSGVSEPVSAWLIQGGQAVMRLGASALAPGAGLQLPDEGWEEIQILPNSAVPSPYTMDVDYATTLHAQNQGYNYVIIAHEKLVGEARVLADYRREEGHQVLLVDVQEIYDEFNFGYPESEAIRRFLRYAQSEWQGLSPEFVVLVGDSSWDHRDREGTNSVDQVPTYAPLNNPQKDGSDEWYAYLWGDKNDFFSDAIVGRISVRKPEELAGYIDKVIRYENESPVGPWKARNLFITDDTFESYGKEAVRESLPPQFIPRHVDQIDYAHITNPYLNHRFAQNPDPSAREYTNKKYCSECTQEILKGIDDGALLVQYIGHGGNQIWSHERIFYGTDRPYSNVLELKPNNRFPFVMNWSCLTGYLNFNIPPFNVCLAEEFIRFSDRGAIAMWAPSGSGSTDQHMLMTHILSRSLFEDGLTRLGESATATKVEYMTIQYHPDLMRQYILFGDPGVHLAIPEEKLEVAAEPTAIASHQPTEYQVQTQVTSFSEGKAIVTFVLEGVIKYQSEPFAFSNGEIAHAFSYEAGRIQQATGSIGVYAWNEAENLDAWGGVYVRKKEPNLIFSRGEVQAEGDGGEAFTIRFAVNNPTAFDVQTPQFMLNLGEREEFIAAEAVPAGATVAVEWQGEAEPGALVATIGALADPEQNLQETKPSQRLSIPLPGHESLAILPLIGQMSPSSQDLVEGMNARLHIPFRNLSRIEDVTATVSLAGIGAATEAKTITLRSGEERLIDFSVTMPELGQHTYILRVQSEDSDEQEYFFTLDVWGKPDLALAEGEFRIEPQIPVVGKTVYITTTVYNVGEGPATDIAIAAYDGDPSLNRRLQSFNNRRQPTISRLEPGEMEEVKIVWDPEAYEGVGVHQIHLVVDPYERIAEMAEENNRIQFPLTLANLPDLVVDSWNEHSMTAKVENGIAEWGQPMKIWARIRNLGHSAAEDVRVAIFHNQTEYSSYFPLIPPTGGMETSFDVPLVSARNTLRVHADRYDLIGELNETAEEQANNKTLEKRMYVQLRMPESPVENGKRVYSVQSETQFSAGLAEFLVYDPKWETLNLHPNMNEPSIHIMPSYVDEITPFQLSYSADQWFWNTRHNSFVSPTKSDAALRVNLPAPNGTFDVYLQIYSDAYQKDASGVIQYKTGQDTEYITLAHEKNDHPRSMHKLGTYAITNDRFMIEFKAVPGLYNNTIGDVLFLRPRTEEPVSAGYLSPFFPATGSGSGFAEVSWEVEIPEGTNLRVKARWVNQGPDGSIRYFPWARIVDGNEKRLRLPGKGDYLQYHVEFIRYPHNTISPKLKRMTVTIPGKATVSRK